MKQIKQMMYESPKVELIEIETQGSLCLIDSFHGEVMDFSREVQTITWG